MLLTLLACSKPPPLILLISLDTTRADALGPYGGKGTPTIDRLADDGVTFEWALSGSSTTPKFR